MATLQPAKSNAPHPMATPSWSTALPLLSTHLCMQTQVTTPSKTLYPLRWVLKRPTSLLSTPVWLLKHCQSWLKPPRKHRSTMPHRASAPPPTCPWSDSKLPPKLTSCMCPINPRLPSMPLLRVIPKLHQPPCRLQCP